MQFRPIPGYRRPMRLNLHRAREPQAVSQSAPQEAICEDPPGTVRFQTEIAKQRFIRLEPMGDVVRFVAPGSACSTELVRPHR